MITTFEAGAVFKIVNEASPVLRELSRDVTKLDKSVTALRLNIEKIGTIKLGAVTAELRGLTDTFVTMRPELSGVSRQLGLVDRRLAALTATAGTSRGTLAGTFNAMTAGTSAALAEVRALNAEWRALALSVAATGRAARVGSARNLLPGAGGGHGGRGGVHVSSLSAPLPGGMHARFHGGDNAAMAGLGAIAYGVYKEAELQDAIFQMKWHAGVANTPQNDNYFRNLIQTTASETGFGYKEIAEAATDEIRLMKGADGKESGGLAILPEMLRASATEARVKPGTSLESAMTSLVEMAHMAQQYGIDDIKGMAPLLAFLSTTNPATMPQMTRAASYAMPILHSALGVDPADVLMETTALARAGATNTKSGTWVRAAFERSLPPDARLVGDKEYARRMFAMRRIGLVDENGKSTVLNSRGLLDIDRVKSVVSQHTVVMSIVDRNNFLKKTFGEQGERGIELLMQPAVVAQESELRREFPDFKNRYGTFLEDYGNQSPVQKSRQAFEDLTNVLADIGTVALPSLVAGLHAFDEVLKATTSLLPSTAPDAKDSFHVGLNKALGKGMAEGAGPGALIGGGIGFLAGGVGAGPGAGLGAAIGAVAGGAYEGGKYIWSQLTAPKTEVSIQPGKVSINLDGRQIADAVIPFIAKDGAGPVQGAPYHDSTYSTSPTDFAVPF